MSLVAMMVGLLFAYPAIASAATGVSGTVTDESGNPIAGICVTVATSGRVVQAEVQTAGNGTYLATGLSEGSHLVRFRDCDGPTFEYEFYSEGAHWGAASSVFVTNGQVIGGIDATLAPEARISGRVTDWSGQPLSGVSVYAYLAEIRGGPLDGNYVIGSAETDAAGAYSIRGLRATDYEIRAYPAEPYISEQYGGSFPVHVYRSFTPVPAVKGENTSNIDFRLKQNLSVAGTVTDTKGNGLADCEVTIGGRGGRSNQSGQYSVLNASPSVIDGELKLDYSASCPDPKYPGISASASGYAPSTGPQSASLNITVPLFNSIGGTVSDMTNQPLPGCDVTATSVDGFWLYYEATTDSAGRYSIQPVQTGRYRIFIDCAGQYPSQFHDGQVDPSKSRPIELTGGDDVIVDAQMGGLPVTECADGIDNDGDDRTDFLDDPGCSDESDVSELGSAECDNGIDDDGNDLVDFRSGGQGDPGCDSLTDEIEASGACEPVDSQTKSFRTITPLLGPVPDIHWYSTKIRADLCERDGKSYITQLGVDRHIEKGPIPRAIGLVGWKSGIETEVEFDPPRFDEALVASTQFIYTACFDLTKLLDKAGLKKRLKAKIQKPLAKDIAKALKKSGLTKINKKVRKNVMDKFEGKVIHALKKGTIKTYLRDKFKIPTKIGGLAEKLTRSQQERIKAILITYASKSLGSGRYDGMTAKVASEAITYGAFRELSELASFCGRIPGLGSQWFRLWEANVTVSAGSDVSFERDDLYKHPLMSIREG